MKKAKFDEDPFRPDGGFSDTNYPSDPARTDWYALIDQVKPMVEKVISEFAASGNREYYDAVKAGMSIPAWLHLYKKIDRESGWEASDLQTYMQWIINDAIKRHGIKFRMR